VWTLGCGSVERRRRRADNRTDACVRMTCVGRTDVQLGEGGVRRCLSHCPSRRIDASRRIDPRLVGVMGKASGRRFTWNRHPYRPHHGVLRSCSHQTAATKPQPREVDWWRLLVPAGGAEARVRLGGVTPRLASIDRNRRRARGCVWRLCVSVSAVRRPVGGRTRMHRAPGVGARSIAPRLAMPVLLSASTRAGGCWPCTSGWPRCGRAQQPGGARRRAWDSDRRTDAGLVCVATRT
jgi:hypothetical protein